MKSISPGHKYELESMDGGTPQILTFIQKSLNEETGAFETVEDGTTNEEVLSVLIDRVAILNEKAPCIENQRCLSSLNQALAELNLRTHSRRLRGVEGTPKP